jgi:DNA-directed RNA polymerase subunit L
MAKKNTLADVGKRVGAALGKANKKAHIQARKVSAASKVAKEELKDISKQVEALKKQLEKTAKRLRSALD